MLKISKIFGISLLSFGLSGNLVAEDMTNSAEQAAVVHSNLDIYIPSLSYGGLYFWLNFQYQGATGSDHLWKLSNYGVNQQNSDSVSSTVMNSNLDIHIPSANYAGSDIWLGFQYQGGAESAPLWKINNFGINQQVTPCQRVENSILQAGFDDVSVTCDNTYAYINSDTYPDHDKMNGITGTNEQIPVPALNYASPIRLNPTGTSNAITIDASLGVAINGVPIYDYSSQGDLDVFNYDPNIDTFLLGQLDNCGGHAGRGDDYHYHARPTCMIDAMLNYSDAAIIGWAYDGYPIYDTNNPDGTTISAGSLDVCNGQTDSTFGYRYHTSFNAPYVPQCLRGDIDLSKMPRVAPMRGRTTGTPPQGGVSNLVFTQQGDTVRMDYTHQGQNYYLQYTASSTPNCYLFETKTVTEGGEITTGEFCR